MSKIVSCERLNSLGQFDQRGRLFVNPKMATVTDLSDLVLLTCGVDTVRQMYKGRLRPEVLELFEEPRIVSFAGYAWHAGKVGKDSGYQYKLQNSDLGLILLIKNYNVQKEEQGPHLKIEVSPHLIKQNEPARLQKMLDTIADHVLTEARPNYCAVHIALDVQGWEPPSNTVERMHCRSQKVRDINGISDFVYAANASVYGRGETYMFGSPGAVQLSIYNKTKQAKATDKLDYWESVWGLSWADLDTPLYDKTKDVWRIELRFHHSVVKQFAEGSFNLTTGETINPLNYADLSPHLCGLWKYGFNAFKLLSAQSSKVIAPEWSIFADDLMPETGRSSLLDETEYKRYYKSASGFSGKNVELFLGNFVSLLARERQGATKGFRELKKSVLWPTIKEFFENKEQGEQDIYNWIRDKLTERTIRWGVAV